MSGVNFLEDNEEAKIKKQEEGNEAEVKWTAPGTLDIAEEKNKKAVEDIFAETETAAKSVRQVIVPTAVAASKPAGVFNVIKNLFAKKETNQVNGGIFKKNKAELNGYHQTLQTENAKRKNNEEIGEIKIDNKKSYFKRDQWRPSNVIKTNLIQTETSNTLDWSGNINMLLIGISSACLIVALAYLGLQLKESFAVQKTQQISDEINGYELQIAGLKNGLGDIDTFQRKLEIASSLLKKHIYWTNFFKFWEDNLLKDVYFEGGFSGDVGGEYSFTTITDSYTNAANQIRVLREQQNGKEGIIKELTVSQANYSEKKMEEIEKKTKAKGMESSVTFNIRVMMDPKIFYKQ